jgi:hypothetical protein
MRVPHPCHALCGKGGIPQKPPLLLLPLLFLVCYAPGNLLLVPPHQQREELFHVEHPPANGEPLASLVGSGLVSTGWICVIYKPNVPCCSERGQDEMSGVEQPISGLDSAALTLPFLAATPSLTSPHTAGVIPGPEVVIAGFGVTFFAGETSHSPHAATVAELVMRYSIASRLAN